MLARRDSFPPTLNTMSKSSLSSTPNHCALTGNRSTEFGSVTKTSSQKIDSKMATRGRSSLLDLSQTFFRPYSGNPLDPVDICVDAFLSSRSFELTCVQAVQLAAVLPTDPPPMSFTSFDRTPMHHWYEAILMEFVDCFMRRLRTRGGFPTRIAITREADGYKLNTAEDADAFNIEATAHINAILVSFNTRFSERTIGSMSGLTIDCRQPHAADANVALYEATSHADYLPKKNWKVGEPLASEYKKRLRMFEGGVLRLLADRSDDQWILGLPERLNRGIAAYKEYYIRHLRQEIRASRLKQHICMDRDDVFT